MEMRLSCTCFRCSHNSMSDNMSRCWMSMFCCLRDNDTEDLYLPAAQKQDDNISFLAESQSTTHYQHWESTEKGFPVKLGNTSKELHCGQAVEGKWTVRLSDGKTCDLGLNWHRRENSLMCLYWSWSTLYRAAFPTVPRLELMGW